MYILHKFVRKNFVGSNRGIRICQLSTAIGPISSASLITRNEFFSLLWPVFVFRAWPRITIVLVMIRTSIRRGQHSSNTNSSYLDHEKIIDRRVDEHRYWNIVITPLWKKFFEKTFPTKRSIEPLSIKPSSNATKTNLPTNRETSPLSSQPTTETIFPCPTNPPFIGTKLFPFRPVKQKLLYFSPPSWEKRVKSLIRKHLYFSSRKTFNNN